MKFHQKRIIAIVLFVFLLGCSSPEKKQKKAIERLNNNEEQLEEQKSKITKQINDIDHLLSRYNKEIQDQNIILEQKFYTLRTEGKIKKHKKFLKEARTNIRYKKIESVLNTNADLNLMIEDYNKEALEREFLIIEIDEQLWRIKKAREREIIGIAINSKEIKKLMKLAEAAIDENLEIARKYDGDELAKDNFNRLINKEIH